MRLFISYARVDKPYCIQIVETLDVHETWYDHRLNAGQKWWEEILRRLDWCEGFVYLLSPDSVNSEYCQREFAIAYNLGKHIFPVLIQTHTPIPDILQGIQYADLSNGLDARAVKVLLDSIYIAERQGERATPQEPGQQLQIGPPVVNPTTVISEAAEALETGEYDRAVFLLKQAQANGYTSRFIDLNAMLHDAESALERQAYLREAEREYRPIVALVRRNRTFKLGSEAFRAFRRDFPNYDPENLAAVCLSFSLPLLEWCEITPGEVLIQNEVGSKIYEVQAFRISKYPVTNAQFQAFIDAADGYCEEYWWDYSPHARSWRKEHPKALPPKFRADDHPRGNVCWYEAVAFCRWLSHKTGMTMALSSEQQWQRAAQGDENLIYPWGNRFDKDLCNTKESGIRMTTPVTRYAKGVSCYGVYDMAGNVWEWCLTAEPVSGSNGNIAVDAPRAVRGGSFISAHNRSRNGFHYYLNPNYRYSTIGFRMVCLDA